MRIADHRYNWRQVTGRLTPDESFRAKVWRDIRGRSRVLDLPHRARSLLEGIVHTILNRFNNGHLHVGPVTMKRLGFNTKAAAEDARCDLVRAGLLTATTEPRPGATTLYGLTFIPFKVSPHRTSDLPPQRDLVAIGRTLHLLPQREVDIPPQREVTPQNLPPQREEIPPQREVKTAASKERAGVRARRCSYKATEAEMHSTNAAAPRMVNVKGKRPAAARGSHRVPADFTPDLDYALRMITDIDAEAEAAKFRDWEFKKPRSDWAACWRNWIRHCLEDGRYARVRAAAGQQMHNGLPVVWK